VKWSAAGRGGDGAFLAGEHGLIVVAVAGVGLAPAGDVGRQRHAPGALEQQLDRLVALEMEQHRAIIGLVRGDRGHAVAEIDAVAVAQPLGVADEGAPVALSLALVQGRADPGLAAQALELGRDDTGVVEDEAIARPQQAREVQHAVVRDLRTLDTEQPRAVARRSGSQRDAFGREIEVEEVDLHLFSAAGGPGARAPARARAGGPAAAAAPGQRRR
jgi:hypothetical protein